MSPELILASSSPPRQEILDRLGISFRVYSTQLEERVEIEGKSFEDFAKTLALKKAQEAASNLNKGIVIGADSFVVIDGQILGKPGSQKRAIEYLQQLSGRELEFYTAIAVIDTQSKKELVRCLKTRVYFRDLTLEEIREYVGKEEVSSAAGGFRIQGLGATLVEKIEGDYYAVVGLPLSKLQEMLRSLGYNLFDFIK